MGINIDKIVSSLKKEFKTHQMPIVDLIHAQTKDPFKILVTTILSARTKDVITAEVVKKLFQRVDDYHDLEEMSLEEIESAIFKIGFFRNKAKYLKKLPEILEKEFAGKVPDKIDDLVKLPGVGRKTANLVRAIAFEKPAICVDVHVHRICNRLGYINTNTPFETEMKLREILPKKHWIPFNSILVSHGQNICKPRKPMCSKCIIYKECQQVGVDKEG